MYRPAHTPDPLALHGLAVSEEEGDEGAGILAVLAVLVGRVGHDDPLLGGQGGRAIRPARLSRRRRRAATPRPPAQQPPLLVFEDFASK